MRTAGIFVVCALPVFIIYNPLHRDKNLLDIIKTGSAQTKQNNAVRIFLHTII